MPLDLWRNRTYVSSIVATFLVSFGFFGAIIFLPRWFQVVRGESATNSGYLIFPMLIGLIGSSIIAGALVSRTGKYKALVLTGLVAIVVGIGLMTQLRSDTPYPALFLWMFIAGLGIGPSLSVFTIIIQNAVPFSKLGVATSNLTFFRQIGGSVGLAIAGTQFGSGLKEQLPAQITPVVGQVLGTVPPDKQVEIGGSRREGQPQQPDWRGPELRPTDRDEGAGRPPQFHCAVCSTIRPRLQQRDEPRHRPDVLDRRRHGCCRRRGCAVHAGTAASFDERGPGTCRGRELDEDPQYER